MMESIGAQCGGNIIVMSNIYILFMARYGADEQKVWVSICMGCCFMITRVWVEEKPGPVFD